ncbi:hypothetical protein CSOJ01_15469 [Colletotrichum sojae]|uniref:Uncharacterized protein n=1 Tax=Colletotrichum sojae TaxID=2175907 RepID=A0A8H6IMF0_9PEZI|nr:hypothetical protein CSOJ01_15469 [Colletotrichum sojae]
MAPYRTQPTPPSQDAILEKLITGANEMAPRGGLRGTKLRAEMPLLLNPTKAPVPCMEPAEEFDAVNAIFSDQVRAFFNAMHAFEEMADKKSPDEPDLIHEESGMGLAISVCDQSYDIYPDCWHRACFTRRLTVLNPSNLPLLNRVTRLRIYPEKYYNYDLDMQFIQMRPISPHMPFDLIARLPHLRELNCPWLWERLPIAYTSRALRILCRPWEGPWRDARVEFGRAMRQIMPSLLSSLTKARFWFWRLNYCGGDTDQAVQMPDLVRASSTTLSDFEGMDPVSLRLRDLGTRLEELSIRALLTPDLFRSSSWPRMRRLDVEFHLCAPDGRWYFSSPRGEDPHPAGFAITEEEHYPSGLEDFEETHELLDRETEDCSRPHEMTEQRRPDMFRIRPIPERIEPLLLEFALSLRRQNMPSLEAAEISTWFEWLPSDERVQEYEGSN